MKCLLTTKLLLSLMIAYAQMDPVDKDGVAIGGYDVVSYFQSTGPQNANSSLKHVYNAVAYYFMSAENLTLFKENMERYFSQFGGCCALAVSYGKKVLIDPKNPRSPIINSTCSLTARLPTVK